MYYQPDYNWNMLPRGDVWIKILQAEINPENSEVSFQKHVENFSSTKYFQWCALLLTIYFREMTWVSL